MSNSLLGQRDTSLFNPYSVAIPASFMTLGVILNDVQTKNNIQSSILNRFPNLTTSIDDYLSFAPSVLDLNATFVDNNNTNLKHISDIVIAEIFMFASTKSLKLLIDSRRPNGGGQSFPSGHTSQAFTGATLLFHHYKDENFLFASSGFVIASATGFLRITNNRHWMSDVLFGTGLGILVGHLTYTFNPIGTNSITSNLSINTDGTSISAVLRF